MLGTSITLTSPEGDVLAVLSRSGLDIGKATWSVNKTGEIDWRLVLFIPNFKTHSDNQKAAR